MARSKKVVAKKATSAKKVLKKTTKKVSAKAKTNGAGRKRTVLEENAKIQWIGGDEIPGREGSARWKRIANLKKHGGKTVGTFLKSGKSGTLRWCIAHNLAKV